MDNGSCFVALKLFGISYVVFGLIFPFVNAVPNTQHDSLEARLEEIPQRLQQLSQIAFPDGIPDTFYQYYTLPYAKSNLCNNHSLIYRNAAKEFEPWAVQMIDSSGKIPSGFMFAHFNDLGNYHECLNVVKREISKPEFPVQHCVLRLGNFVRLPKSEFLDWENLETVLGGLPVLKPELNLGLCIPASCSLDDISQNYRTIFDRFNLSVHLDKYSCTASNERTPLSTFEWISAIVLLIPIILCIVTTIYDVRNPIQGKPSVLRDLSDTFSLYSNGRMLFKTDNPKRPLSTLNCLRFLSVTWVIMAHHWLFSALRPALNYIEMSQLFTKTYAAAILNGVLAVDIFILLNGLLLSYLFMDVTNKGHKFNLILFYLHRIVRILPGYIVQILLAMTFYPRFFSDGPLWKTTMHRHTESCFNSWWTNVLFINNYVHVDTQCIPSTWYLSVDMQLHIISPIFLFALYKYKWFIKFGIPVCIILANTVGFLNSYIYQFPAGSIISRDFKTVYKYPYEYITTHTKMGPWFVGLGLGYILYHLEGKKIKISPVLVKLAWFMTFVVGGFIIMAITYFHDDNVPYNRLLSSSYTGFHSTIWAFCIGWVIFACETGYGRPVWRLLTWRTFQPLGKVSFVLYMAHIAVQYGTGSARKITGYVEIIPMVRDTFGEIFVCILLSPFLSLFYEAPFIRLEKVFLNRCVLKPKKVNSHDENIEVKGQNEQLVNMNGKKIVITNGGSRNGTSENIGTA